MSSESTAKPQSSSVDVQEQHVADIYARALIAATERRGQTAAVLAELESLEREVLDASPRCERFLTSQLANTDEKLAFVQRAFEGKVSPFVYGLLQAVVRRDRAGCLRALRRRAVELWDEQQGRRVVLVQTPQPLDDASREAIRTRVREVLRAEPILHESINPALLGGVVLRVGDKVFDSSLATQLKRLREQMIERSVHEIQSGRDRFRHSGGN